MRPYTIHWHVCRVCCAVPWQFSMGPHQKPWFVCAPRGKLTIATTFNSTRAPCDSCWSAIFVYGCNAMQCLLFESMESRRGFSKGSLNACVAWRIEGCTSASAHTVHDDGCCCCRRTSKWHIDNFNNSAKLTAIRLLNWLLSITIGECEAPVRQFKTQNWTWISRTMKHFVWQNCQEYESKDELKDHNRAREIPTSAFDATHNNCKQVDHPHRATSQPMRLSYTEQQHCPSFSASWHDISKIRKWRAHPVSWWPTQPSLFRIHRTPSQREWIPTDESTRWRNGKRAKSFRRLSASASHALSLHIAGVQWSGVGRYRCSASIQLPGAAYAMPLENSVQ